MCSSYCGVGPLSGLIGGRGGNGRPGVPGSGWVAVCGNGDCVELLGAAADDAAAAGTAVRVPEVVVITRSTAHQIATAITGMVTTANGVTGVNENDAFPLPMPVTSNDTVNVAMTAPIAAITAQTMAYFLM